MLFVGLNPSYASLDEDDRTIRKCQKFAKRWGFGKYLMCNLFGFRSTDPKGLLSVADPNGEGNDAAIAAAVNEAELIVAAWGANKMVWQREADVLSLLKDPMCLRYTKDGHPEHPLYIPYDTELIRYTAKTPT